MIFGISGLRFALERVEILQDGFYEPVHFEYKTIPKLCQEFNKNSGKYFCKRIAGAKALSYFKIRKKMMVASGFSGSRINM